MRRYSIGHAAIRRRWPIGHPPAGVRLRADDIGTADGFAGQDPRLEVPPYRRRNGRG
jgi:hypothetical protein